MPMTSGDSAENTDRELWREADDYYAPSLHVTEGGGIGMKVGGTVIVLPIRKWHQLAQRAEAAERERDELRVEKQESRKFKVLRENMELKAQRTEAERAQQALRAKIEARIKLCDEKLAKYTSGSDLDMRTRSLVATQMGELELIVKWMAALTEAPSEKESQ